MNKLRFRHRPINEACTRQIHYTLPHGKLTITIAVVPQHNQPPLVYITNENDQIHQRPRCIRTSVVPNFAQTYFYDRACIHIYDEKRYEVDCYVVEIHPMLRVRPEDYLNEESPQSDEERWSIHVRLIECRDIPADDDAEPNLP